MLLFVFCLTTAKITQGRLAPEQEVSESTGQDEGRGIKVEQETV